MSKTTSATPRKKIEYPSVKIIKDTTELSLEKEISFYSTIPTMEVIKIAIIKEAPKNMPLCIKKTADIPPAITNSPWEKFIIPLEL